MQDMSLERAAHDPLKPPLPTVPYKASAAGAQIHCVANELCDMLLGPNTITGEQLT